VRYLIAIAAALLIGCSGTSMPPPSPGNMDDVIAAFVRRGVTVHRIVSGDAGCPSQPLHDNAVHLEVAVGAQSALKHVYLFRWRKPADFAAAADAFGRCVVEYSASNPGAEATQLHLAPWRAYGPWDPQLRSIVEGALRANGGVELSSPSPSAVVPRARAAGVKHVLG
jgi:hypothetical protein